MLLSSQTDSFLAIFERMKNPKLVKAAMLDSVNSNPDPTYQDFPSWNDLSLADGYPSLLLFFSTLQKNGIVDEGKEDIAHRYVLEIKEVLEKKRCENFSLFSGISGICFSLQQASLDGTRYQRMLTNLHAHLLTNIEKMFLEPMRYNLSHHHPISAFFYDPIQGICGIGRYLLEILSFPHCFEIVQNMLHLIVEFIQPIRVNGKEVPGWYSSPDDFLNSSHRSDDFKGNFNLGLAHGITGVLAFLAIALIQGVEVKGQKEAIQYIAAWICEKSFLVNSNIQWPSLISWEEEVEKMPPMNLSCKDAWCYGTPGISRTLFIAGKAVKDDGLKSFAVKAFRGIFNRSQSEWGLPGPMLCHGIAGLLLISRAMAKEKECEDLISRVKELEQTLLSFYNPNFLYGFKDIEPCKNGGIAQVNKVGFLGGATGAFLVLLDAFNVSSKWSLPFLIEA